MKLVFIIGNSAVGKMTVGQALMARTGLRLFHNHMIIEPVMEVFGTFHLPAIIRARDVILEEFVKTDNYGMIFTLMWAFDVPSNWEYVEHVRGFFTAHGADIYYVELIAPQEVRLARNATENRLRHKASKRDIDVSNARLLADDSAHRFESHEGEITFENYLRIDNSALSPEETAAMIQERFSL